MADRQTLDVYARRAGDYAAKFATDRPDRHLKRFIKAMPKGGRVLDLGCGTGRASVFMRDAGLAVDAWDASEEMARIGREANGLDIRIAEFAELSAEAVYDGNYASFSLLHAPKSEMPAHLLRISAALRPGGLLHLGLKTGDGEARDSIGRFYAYYQDAEISALLDATGLAVTSRSFGEEAGLDGTVAPWIILAARKPE